MFIISYLMFLDSNLSLFKCDIYVNVLAPEWFSALHTGEVNYA